MLQFVLVSVRINKINYTGQEKSVILYILSAFLTAIASIVCELASESRSFMTGKT